MCGLQNLRHQRRRWRAGDDLRAAIGAASEAPGRRRRWRETWACYIDFDWGF